MKLKVKKVHPNAHIPIQANPNDAGLDLFAVSEELTVDGIIYHTGISIELPPGHAGLIFPRSSIYLKDLSLANSVGLIDESFRGEIKVIFKPLGNFVKKRYKVGDRIAQLVVLPIPKIEIEETDELSYSIRGSSGFGSSGE